MKSSDFRRARRRPPGKATRPEPTRSALAGTSPFTRTPCACCARTTMRYGEHPWRHWGHPEFVRPVYYWDWGVIHNVTCIAEDSYGDQYPVTESTFAGFGLMNMTAVEDDALDRCYEESGGDQGCYLATCSHY